MLSPHSLSLSYGVPHCLFFCFCFIRFSFFFFLLSSFFFAFSSLFLSVLVVLDYNPFFPSLCAVLSTSSNVVLFPPTNRVLARIWQHLRSPFCVRSQSQIQGTPEQVLLCPFEVSNATCEFRSLPPPFRSTQKLRSFGSPAAPLPSFVNPVSLRIAAIGDQWFLSHYHRLHWNTISHRKHKSKGLFIKGGYYHNTCRQSGLERRFKPKSKRKRSVSKKKRVFILCPASSMALYTFLFFLSFAQSERRAIKYTFYSPCIIIQDCVTYKWTLGWLWAPCAVIARQLLRWVTAVCAPFRLDS